jgi:hypothetical protein
VKFINFLAVFGANVMLLRNIYDEKGFAMAGSNERATMGRRAKELFDEERYEEALEILDNLLIDTPNDTRIRATRDMVQTKWQEKVASAAKQLRPNPALVTREISKALSDTFEDEAVAVVVAPPVERSRPKPNGDAAPSFDEAKQAARQAISGAALVAKNVGGVVAAQASRAITEGTKMAQDAMQSEPGEDEYAKTRTGCNPFAKSMKRYGSYQVGWADTIAKEGRRYEEFKTTFWRIFTDDKGLKQRVAYNRVTVKDERRSEELELARDGIVTALVMINRYGNDLYLSWRMFLRLPFIKWRVILAVIFLIPPLISVGLPVWIFLSVLNIFIYRDPLRWLKGSVSEFDYDDLMAMLLTLDSCMVETHSALKIEGQLRRADSASGFRQQQHI